MSTSKNNKTKKTTTKKAAPAKAATKKAGTKKAVAKKPEATVGTDKRKPGRPRKQAADTTSVPKKAKAQPAVKRPVPNVQVTGVEIPSAATTTTAVGSTPVVTVSASWSNPTKTPVPTKNPPKLGFFARLFKRKRNKGKR